MTELLKKMWKGIGIGGVIIGILLIYFEDTIKSFIMPKWIVDDWEYQLPLVFAIATAVYLYFENKKLNTANNIEKKTIIEKNASLNDQIKKYIKPNEKNIAYLRFEQLKGAEGITYGHIDYDPFFKLLKKPQSAIYEPSGIGYEVLKEIFSVLETPIIEHTSSSTWDNLFEGLETREYDVIATPLYETRSRIYSHSITFCTPLFYSEVGLFVHPIDFNHKYSLKEFREEVEEGKREWQSPFISGEISEIIARKTKVFIDEVTGKVNDDVNGFKNLLNKVNDKKNPENAKFNIVAMEVFKAHAIMNSVNEKLDLTIPHNENRVLKLKNILDDLQLLYPVSFVVRKEDTVLRNLINLRIAEIRDRKSVPGGKLSLIDIIKRSAQTSDGIDPSYVDSSLIQKYDFATLESQKRSSI